MKTSLRFTILLVLSLAFSGCYHEKYQETLERIDTLLSKDMIDSAYHEFNRIEYDNINDEEDQAYYHLISTRLDYMRYVPISSLKNLEKSIAYYQKYNDDKKLADAYFYKGAVLIDQNKYKNAALALKKAEYYNDNINNTELQYKISEKFSFLNEQICDYKTALSYSHKNLNLGLTTKNTNWIVYAMGNLAVEYYGLKKIDSCQFYLTSCIPYLNKVPKKDRAFFYLNIGYIYSKYDKASAKQYLAKALEIAPLPNTYNALALLQYKDGNKTEAIKLWKKALQAATDVQKKRYMGVLADIYANEGNYKEAYLWSKKRADLVDETYSNKQREDIKQIQSKFDLEMQSIQYKEHIKLYWTILILAVILSLLIIVSFYYKYNKVKLKNIESNLLINISKRQIEKLQKSDESNLKEVTMLKEEVSQMNSKRQESLYHGHMLFEEIQNGGNIAKWTKRDFIHFIEYYKLHDLPFINHLTKDYEDLSPRYMFFSILEHMKKNEEEIENIMCISRSSLRSIRTRVKQRALLFEDKKGAAKNAINCKSTD